MGTACDLFPDRPLDLPDVVWHQRLPDNPPSQTLGFLSERRSTEVFVFAPGSPVGNRHNGTGDLHGNMLAGWTLKLQSTEIPSPTWQLPNHDKRAD
jgi:hypothetical protein